MHRRLAIPNPAIDYSAFLPLAGMTAPPPWNTYPYNENYFFSIEHPIRREHALMSLSYVGSQAHHLAGRIFCRIPAILGFAWP